MRITLYISCDEINVAKARFSPANSKWTKHTVADHVRIGGNGPVLVGTPAQVADGLEIWIDEAGVDGFNFVRFLSVCILNYVDLTRLGICALPSIIQRHCAAFAAGAPATRLILGWLCCTRWYISRELLWQRGCEIST